MRTTSQCIAVALILVVGRICHGSVENCTRTHVSMCSSCAAPMENPMCGNRIFAHAKPYCYRKTTYSEHGIYTEKGTASIIDCSINAQYNNVNSPDCKLASPPPGTICYDCCFTLSCDPFNNCNDAQTFDPENTLYVEALNIPKDATTTTQKATTPSPQAAASKVPLTADRKNELSDVTRLRSEKCYQCGDESRGIPCTTEEMNGDDGSKSCSVETGYCLTTVKQEMNGIEHVYKRCANESECNNLWWKQTSDKDACQNYPTSETNYTCHFCCTTSDCNLGTKPESSTLYKTN